MSINHKDSEKEASLANHYYYLKRVFDSSHYTFVGKNRERKKNELKREGLGQEKGRAVSIFFSFPVSWRGTSIKLISYPYNKILFPSYSKNFYFLSKFNNCKIPNISHITLKRKNDCYKDNICIKSFKKEKKKYICVGKVWMS